MSTLNRLFAVSLIQLTDRVAENKKMGFSVKIRVTEVNTDGTTEPNKVPLLTGTDYKELQQTAECLHTLTVKYRVRPSREARQRARDARRLAKLQSKVDKLQTKLNSL